MMDFISLLRERATHLPPDERRDLYAALRHRVREFEASVENEANRRAGQSYSRALEAAIRQFEVELADISLPEPDMPVSQPWPPAAAESRMAAPVAQADDGSSPTRHAAEAAVPAEEGRGGLVRLVMGVVIGCIVGAGALTAYQSIGTGTGAGQVLADRFAQGRGAVDKNLEMVRALRVAIEDHRRGTGAFPSTVDTWVPFSPLAETIPALKAALGRVEGPKDRLLFRGNATDYKLILHHSGDCFIVRITNPELVDPARSAGPVDCYAYGFWSAGAATW